MYDMKVFFQAQITEQQNLASTEQKLQEELHVEQAVQDIVRLIKQDARTALLIVQLLRRYQLERSQVYCSNSYPCFGTGALNGLPLFDWVIICLFP